MEGGAFMYQLIFFDDERDQLEIISEKVGKYCRERELLHGEAVLCQRPEELWEALKKQEIRPTILFMDIYMEQENFTGVDVAAQVNTQYPYVFLVFLTGYLRYASDVYETEHCYFMLKEELEQRLPVLFEKVLPVRLQKNQKWLDLHIGFRVHRVLQLEILYLERDLRKTKIFLRDGSVMETTEKLSQLADQMDSEEFVRCHNSFIVHLKYVCEIDSKNIRLTNQVCIPVSRAYVREIKQRFSVWGSRNMGR